MVPRATNSGASTHRIRIPLPFATPEVESGPSIQKVIARARIPTVCEEAACPNYGECWSSGRATFLILGDRCTRRCHFCNITTGRPAPLDPEEPGRLALAVREMGLEHVVITSVTRDDLVDGGAAHFAAAVEELHRISGDVTVEILIPDFKGETKNLEKVWKSKPELINHNVETVASLYQKVCPQARYDRSLKVLRESAEQGFLTKSGLMLGLGESMMEVRDLLLDLRNCGVQMVTIGQYLSPGPQSLPVEKVVSPEEFLELEEFTLRLGFLHVESGPLVRSSYHAGRALKTKKNRPAP